MKNLIILMIAGLMTCAGYELNGQNHDAAANIAPEHAAVCDTIKSGNQPEYCEEEDSPEEYDDTILDGNEARFHNWADEDWYDNDYYRILRKFFDAYVRGEIEERDELAPLKPMMKGKFTVYNAAPFMLGGLFIYFVFLESPNDIYEAWVYSYVENGEVYIDLSSVRSIEKSDMKTGLTKEDIYRIIEEHPENKLW